MFGRNDLVGTKLVTSSEPQYILCHSDLESTFKFNNIELCNIFSVIARIRMKKNCQLKLSHKDIFPYELCPSPIHSLQLSHVHSTTITA